MIKTIRQLARLFQINWVIASQGLDRVIFPKNHVTHYLTYLNPWNWFRSKKSNEAEDIRIALEKLGPIFVKFGQLLSTRRDFIPDDIAKELSKLQDQVPPFPFSEFKARLEKTYQASIEETFASFDETPLASASIAQVHAAQLKTGESVVVKVLRPHIHKTIAHDLALLDFMARFFQKFLRKNSGLQLPSLVAEFKKTLLSELDLVREGANASELRRNFADSDLLYIPKIYWDYTYGNVLVMERIYGIPVTDVAGLKAAHMPLKEVADAAIELFFTQVFRDSFFHADMHPGNIFVEQMPSGKIRYILVDFGIVGSLDPRDQYYLAENIVAFLDRDYRRVALLHIESGWLKGQVDVQEFEASIRAACEPIFEKPLKDISLAQVLVRLFQTARRFNMEVQPQLLLLQKTLFNLEGIVRQIYPDMDFWGSSRPILERWIREQHHPIRLLKRVKKRFPYWFESFIESVDAKRVKSMMMDVMLPPEKVEKESKGWKSQGYFCLGAVLGVIASSLILYLY